MSSRGGDYGGTYGYEQRLAAAANQRSSSMGQPPSPVIDRRSQGASSMSNLSSTSSAGGSREVQGNYHFISFKLFTTGVSVNFYVAVCVIDNGILIVNRLC
jgi:hypothetical protein